jgi:hypothetical protein
MPAISQLADPSIYGSQQAPKGTSLQEMLDLSRSNVAFQKERALLPSQIQQGQAQAQTAVTQADTAKLDNALKHIGSIVQNQQTLLTKPDLTSDDIVNATKEQAARMGTPESAVNQALANIPVNGSPTELRSYLAMNLTKTLGAQSQLEKLYPGGVLPAQLPEGGYQVNKPAAEVGAAPMGGAEQPRGVTPSDMGQPPKAEYSKPVPLSYPIRQAGQAFTALPSEEEDRKVGSASRSALVARQSELPMARRSVDEVIKKAQELEEGAMKDMLWKMAERMEREQFIDYCSSEMGQDPVEMSEFWDNINGKIEESHQEYHVRYLPSESDDYKIEKGFVSRKEAEDWIKGENLHNRADEIEIEIAEGIKGALAGAVAGAALTKTPGGAIRGAQIGNKLGDMVSENLTWEPKTKPGAVTDEHFGEMTTDELFAADLQRMKSLAMIK